MRVRHLFFWHCILFFSIGAFAQDNGHLIEQSFDLKIPFTITQFSTKDGLPQSQILDIVPKANGSLIIATAAGIMEYDGAEFKPFIKSDLYKGQIYTRIFWHDKHKLLLAQATDGSIYLLYPEYKKIERKFRVFSIYEDSIFCITNAGVIYAAHIQALEFKQKISTGIKDAGSLYYSPGYFYIGHKDGVTKYDLKKKSGQLISKEFCLLFKKNPYDSVLYGLSGRKVRRFSDSITTAFELPASSPETLCHQFVFTAPNEFYVATTRGLYEITKEYTDVYTKTSALPSMIFQSLYYNDAENCLFLGSGEKGLLKLHFKNCYSYYTTEGFGETSSLSSIIKTKAGDILLSDPHGIVYKMDLDTVYPLVRMKPFISSLSEIDGLIYIGTWGKGILLAKNGVRVDSILHPQQLPSASVHSSFKDSRGKIWIGTSEGIARGTEPKNIKPFLTGIIEKFIINFYELRNGNICIGGSEGVYIIDKNDKCILHLGRKEGISGREVRCFYEDEEGKLWIGTYGGGLYCYYKNKLTPINSMRNARLNTNVFCMAKDDQGYIYMTSNHGLWRVKEKDLSDFYYGKLNYLIPFHYDEEAGILNTEFNGGFQNNYLKTKFNHFYFPTLQGVVIVFPEELNLRKLVPVIKNVLINDTIYDKDDRVFERETFSVEFNFSCTSFLTKYNIYYQYKLDGENATEWSALSKDKAVTYKLIPPGSYTFSVRAIDAFNDKHPKIISYRFEIKPYFYERLWVRISAVLLFVFLTFIIARYRFQNYRRKAEERERTQRQMAELKLQAIQSQMNPHFIFNSLNSIKYYLSINDQKNADMYIDHFSKLLRNFLESGSKSFIILSKEIQIITSYLELEKQRMNPSFDFSITYSEDLNNVLIPTHLIQPFVENAIKHGINHSLKKCKLEIHFEKTDQVICCTITDDGIGRARSQEINKKRPYEHASKGVEIVLEKIRIVKEIYDMQVKLMIDDKLDGDARVSGTRVTLIIPIKKNENTNS